MTTQIVINGTETTRELLDLRRTHIRERRQRRATLLTSTLLPFADYRHSELRDQSSSPKIA